MNERSVQVKEILDDLRTLQERGVSGAEEYGLQANINFFEALRSPISYVRWLLGTAKQIDGKKLLELTDFPFPRWQEELHLRLIEMEKKEFPGMISPLRDAIVDFILKEKPRFIMDFGSGGMEIERQVIEKLKDIHYEGKLCFVGADLSETVHGIAKKNLNSLIEDEVDFYEEEHLTAKALQSIFANLKKNIGVVLCKNDIFKLPAFFTPQTIDIVIYSKFRHHLTEEGKELLGQVCRTIARVTMEYDDYFSLPMIIPQSIAAWKYPVLLNGAVFSRLRDPSKAELRAFRRKGERVEFFKIGSYLRIYHPQ